LHSQIISGWLSRWELATPQIREYYNWSLECNYAGRGTELYNTCITNQLRDVNTLCRRIWYIAAHIWKIYDFKIEVVPFIINFGTELTTVVKFEV
jgi:hypothetical protein